MEAKEHKITVSRSAHYYTLGEDMNSAQNIWIVFHGYGQLASQVIQKFDHLDLSKHFVIALEGLSKFYWSRITRTIGASWMTKAHREDEIDDYLRYFDQVLTPFLDKVTADQKLRTLGFSQGSSTMWRWIANRKPPLYQIINWAGEFPPELDYQSLNSYLSGVERKFYCCGDRDELVSSSDKRVIKGFVEKNNMNFEFLEFAGKHIISRAMLARIA